MSDELTTWADVRDYLERDDVRERLFGRVGKFLAVIDITRSTDDILAFDMRIVARSEPSIHDALGGCAVSFPLTRAALEETLVEYVRSARIQMANGEIDYGFKQLRTAADFKAWLKRGGKKTYRALMEKISYTLIGIDAVDVIQDGVLNIAITFQFMAGRSAGPVKTEMPQTDEKMELILHAIADQIEAERLPREQTCKDWESKRGKHWADKRRKKRQEESRG